MAHLRPVGKTDHNPLYQAVPQAALAAVNAPSQSPRVREVRDSERMDCAAVDWARKQDVRSASAGRLLIEIAASLEDGRCAVGQVELGRACKLSERQTRTLLSGLIADGFVKRARNGGAGKGRAPDTLELVGFVEPEQPAIPADSSNRQPAIFAGSDEATGNFERQSSPVAMQQAAISAAFQPPGASPAHTRVEDNPIGYISPRTPTPASELSPEPSETGIEPLSCRKSNLLERLPEHARRIVEAVASPKLDPETSHGLFLNTEPVESWIAQGLDLEADIIPEVAKRVGALNCAGEPVKFWSFFDKGMRAIVTKRKRAEAKAAKASGAAACFEELWRMWPAIGRGRSSKAKALAALEKRTEAPEAILRAARSYLASKDITRPDSAGAKGLHCWISDRLDSFLDETPHGSQAAMPAWMARMEAEAARRGPQ